MIKKLLLGQNNAKAAATWYLICTFLVKGFAFLTTPIFTRVMTTDEYGVFATYSSYLSFFTILATLDLYSCIQISKKDFREDNDSFVSSIMFLSGISVVIFYVLIKIYLYLFSNPFDLPDLMIDALFAYIFFNNAFVIMQTHHRAYMMYKEFVVCTLLFTIFSIILSLIFVLSMESDKFWGRVWGGFIPTFCIGIYAIIRTYRKGHCLVNGSYWRYGLLFSLPLIAHHIAGNVLSSFDRIMINNFCGAADVARYSLPYNIAAVISMVWYSFNSAWIPWFYDCMAVNRFETIRKAVRPYTIVFSFLVLFTVAIGPEILHILGPSDYWDGQWIIPPVCLGVFFQFMYSLYVNIEMYHRNTKMIAVGTVGVAFLNIGLNFIFIPAFGYITAAYTTLVGYIALFAVHYVIAGKLEKEDLYRKRFIFKAITSMVMATILLTILYQFITIRYVTLFLFLTIVIGKFKDEIYDTFRQIKRK